jgi:glycosyltransferase involved in cell wall biosynthesis
LNDESVVVSAVIPTRGRPEMVTRAVRSALAQSLRALEVIVVVDGPDPETEAALARIGDARLRVVRNERTVGGSETRNIGARAARGGWVAFLDDDDEWLPEKLARQLQAAAAGSGRVIVSCRLIARSPHGDSVWPRRLPAPGQSVGDYLFIRRSLFQGEALLQTSTLMAPRDLLLEVPFTPGLRKHQDWDWLLRATTLPGVQVVVVPEPLAVWTIEEDRSTVSGGADWRFSLQWIGSHRERVSRGAYACYVATQVGYQAAQTRDWRLFARLLAEMFRGGSPRPRDVALFTALWVVPPAVRRRLRLALSRARP